MEFRYPSALTDFLHDGLHPEPSDLGLALVHSRMVRLDHLEFAHPGPVPQVSGHPELIPFGVAHWPNPGPKKCQLVHPMPENRVQLIKAHTEQNTRKLIPVPWLGHQLIREM